MFIGHLAVGLAATRLVPTVPLAPLLVASLIPDLLIAEAFHSLPALAVQMTVVCVLALRCWGQRAALVLTGLVLSHVSLDLITSEIRLWPSGPTVGLSLYDRPLLDLALEVLLLLGCWRAWNDGLPRGAPGVLYTLTVLTGSQVVFAIFVASTANG